MKSSRGFSLIELMISLGIGMVVLVFVTRTMVTYEVNRRSSIGNSDSIQNGTVALLTMESEASASGWGLNHPQVSGCTASFSDSKGFTLANVGTASAPVQPLAPVVVNFSANAGDPDVISFYAGSALTGTGAFPLFSDANAGATSIDLNDPVAFGFKQNDVLLISQTNGTCAMVEAVSAPIAIAIGSSTVSRINLGDRFSPAAGLPAAYPSNANKTLVFNLGNEANLALHTWSIINNVLMLNASNLAGSSAVAQPVVSNIVSIKALYGFDITPAATWVPDSGLTITPGGWQRRMIDADGDGITGGRGDYQRLAAVRLAIVARSREREKEPASGVCTTTTTLPTVFSDPQANGTDPNKITINVTAAGDTTGAWKCYAYQTFETVVPLRNAGWRPGS
jgi:type IV pilus assembly protein PilW